VFDTAVEAERFRLATEKVIAAERAPSIAVAEHAEHWLRDREATHRDTADARKFVTHYLERVPIGRMPIAEVTQRDIEQWARSIAREPSPATGRARSQSTISNACSRMRSLFAHAMAEGVIRSNPASGLKAPRARVEAASKLEEETLYLTREEIERVLALELRPDQRAAFVVGVFVGLRAGELAGLRWEDVRAAEGERPELVVRRSRRGATKGNRVERVPLLPPAAAALLGLRASLPKPPRPDALVFPSRHGGPYSAGYDFGWTPHDGRPGIRERAGIRAGITWHAATRHTCATHLLLGTWVPDYMPRALRIEEVSRWLRHRSIGVTQRYAHLSADALSALVSVPNSVPSEIRESANPLKSLAPPARIERATNGLGNVVSIVDATSEIVNGDRVGDRALERAAIALLEAVERRSPFVVSLAVQLATSVLEAHAATSSSSSSTPGSVLRRSK